MEISILNRQKKIKINAEDVRKNALLILKKLKIDCELNILFTDNKSIQLLNRKYRRKNKPTDVLSFQQDRKKVKNKPLVLGDIVISAEKARSQAKEYSMTLKEEIRALVRHGILHLCGFSHAKMKAFRIF